MRLSALSQLVHRLNPGAAALGLQMAVAGTGAFFFSQLLRLQYPSWSVLTVILLVMAQYVGAIQEKAFFRMLGTIIGGILGYLATGAWQQLPVLYLTTTFVVVAICVAMFSQSRAPYAFFLTGLTFVVIASNGQAHPDMSWAYALARTEEVLIGVIASIVAQSLIFPLYANRDFLKQLRLSFAELAEATPRVAAIFQGGQSAGLLESLHDFPSRASAMRNLLRFGGRESRFFRRDIGSFAAIVTNLVRAANLLRSLAPVPAAPEPYRSKLGEVIVAWGQHLGGGWEILSKQEQLDSSWFARASELEQAIETSLLELRQTNETNPSGSANTGDLSIYLLTLRELQNTLGEINRLLALPEALRDQTTNLALAPAWPDRSWFKHGLRAAVATVIALVLLNWLNPPGGTLMVLVAFVFTAMNALSPEGSGDRGAFTYVVIFALVLAGTSFALVAGTPLLASYAVLNTLLVTWLFLLGYWMYNRGGVTVPVQFSFLLLVSILSLNPQEPVNFEKIVGLFFGLLNGMIIAAVVQRLIWPILPQRQLQKSLSSNLHLVANSLEYGFDHLPLWQRTRLGLLPSQARNYIRKMDGPTMPPEQSSQLVSFVTTLQQLIGEIALCSGRLSPIISQELQPILGAPLAKVKTTLAEGLNNLGTSFSRAEKPQQMTTTIQEVINTWSDSITRAREEMIRRGSSPRDVIPILGHAARYLAALKLLQQADSQAQNLQLREYLPDVAL
jgi:uncharacterized membrane protein YccC